MEEITLRVEGVYLCPPKPAVHSVRVDELTCVVEGLVGDRHFGISKEAGVRERGHQKGEVIRNNRQFSAISVEELRRITELMELDDVRPEMIGANIIFSGMQDFTFLPAMTKLWFEGGPVLVVYGENMPCKAAGDEIQRSYPDILGLSAKFVKTAIGQRGIVGWVEKPGTILKGQVVQAIPPKVRAPY